MRIAPAATDDANISGHLTWFVIYLYIVQHSAVRDLVVVGSFLAVATSNPAIEVIDLNRMKPHGTLEGHIMAVSALASLNEDTLLVSGSHDTFLR